jgi:signal transduction histidine kinase
MPLLKIDTAALKLSRTGQNDLSEELSSLVLSIRQSTSHVMNLLNSLMKATEAEANEKPRHILRPVWFDVRHVLLACCLRQQELTETQLISREIPETAEHIFTDPKLFEIMIGGLISSCLRFAPTSPHLLVRLISDEDSVSIELKFSPLPLNEMAWNDSSKGLFDALGSGMKGFELQLGLCKQFLELQGGTMEVSIDKGRGASLILTLPRHFTEQAGADDKAAA